VWVGLALLPSAALARCYASRDLRAQPWHLLLPLAASLVLSLALCGVLYARLAVGQVEAPPFPAGHRSLLGLFLLPAPLSGLYALPCDRLDARRAVRLRLAALGLVAAWRVALMSRAVGVLLDGHFAAAFLLVMLVADGALVLGLLLTARGPGVGRSTPM